MSGQHQWVPSNLFIGRTTELEIIEEILTPESNFQILAIHTDGEGGIGKTKLLSKVLEHCQTTDYIVSTTEFIDFYETESRSKIGVMQQIAKRLGTKDFSSFENLVIDYLEQKDPSKRSRMLKKAYETFEAGYANFVRAQENKVIAIFLDTYEFIQRTPIEIEGKRHAESTGLSRWIETTLLPSLVVTSPNTRIIISGRYPLKEIPSSKISVKELVLPPFESNNTDQFLQECFGHSTRKDLVQKIGSDDDLNKIQILSKGRPILLALFVDWMNYDEWYKENPLSPHGLIEKIEQEKEIISSSATAEQYDLFEYALIERVASLKSPESPVIISMAVAYHRMTPELFKVLNPGYECDAVFKRLGKFSFIKPKSHDILVLHDEMRRMVIDWLNKYHDRDRSLRKEIVKDIVSYYDRLLEDNSLSLEQREMYLTERIEYAFLAAPQEGLQHFRNEFEENFDTYIDDGRYDYCDMLLRDAEMIRHENPQVIDFPYYVELDWRRIQYNNETDGNSQESIHLANTVLKRHKNEHGFRENSIYGHILMQRGIAEFWSEKFEEAKASLQKASTVFEKQKDYIALHTCRRWIGYVHYRRSQFEQAEYYYKQSREGFHKELILLNKSIKSASSTKLRKMWYRSLLQGIQLSFGNLAILYHYIGRVDEAIPYAEIALEIARALPENAIEIARIRATLGRVFAGIGRRIDAGHHLRAAQEILQRDVDDPFLEGRVKTDLGILSYRGSELERILEYYRAGDIPDIIKKYAPNPSKSVESEDGVTENAPELTEAKDSISDTRPNLRQAQEFITHAIDILKEEKERSDAYYALGELYIVMPSDDHWQHAEKAFLEALALAKKSQFEYRKIDTLESLVTLYYFWNGDQNVPEEQKPRCRADSEIKKIDSYHDELEQFHQTNPMRYPDLFGKYYITLGDIAYDQGTFSLKDKENVDLATITAHFRKAFEYYLKAVALMNEFNKDAYYEALRIFYNRLRTLVDTYYEHPMLSQIFDQIHDIYTWMTDTDETVRALYDYVRILIAPSESSLQEKLHPLQTIIQRVLDQGNFGRALLLTDCLIGIYHALLRIQPRNETDLEDLIFYLRGKSVYYRRLGNTYQAHQYLSTAKDKLKELKALPLQRIPIECPDALDACLKATEGTLLYRRGGYEQILEFYLRDELDVARQKFDKEFDKENKPKVREQALQLLQEGENTLKIVIQAWEQQKEDVRTKNGRLLKRYRAQLGETRFRLGELLMLHEDFVSSTEFQNIVFGYFKQAIADAEASDYDYLRENARQGWFNALYFSGIFANSDPEKKQQQQKLEHQLEGMMNSGRTLFPSVMGKFRITQGDILFSRYLKSGDGEREDETLDSDVVQKMLNHYVAACDFMAQHGSQDFAAALRTLQRRIQLIEDADVMEMVHDTLKGALDSQEQYTKELQTLRQFAQLRSIVLAYKKITEHETLDTICTFEEQLPENENKDQY